MALLGRAHLIYGWDVLAELDVMGWDRVVYGLLRGSGGRWWMWRYLGYNYLQLWYVSSPGETLTRCNLAR